MQYDIDTALSERWYYTVELRPGKFTKGFQFKNIAATRAVLDAIKFSHPTVLDVSTMEGMFSLLLARRGAQVTATDAIDLTEKISFLKEIYGEKYFYYPHFPVRDYANAIFSMQSSKSFSPIKGLRCVQNSSFGYDMVLSSGVIYHVLNPIDHIMTYRQLTKAGGLCVIESAVLLSDEIEIVHDWLGETKTFGGNATWFMSTRALEVFLRACFFDPLGYAWVESAPYGDRKLARLAVVARAVRERPFSDDEKDFVKGSELIKNYDFKQLYPAAQLTGDSKNPPEVDLTKIHSAPDLRGSSIVQTSPVNYKDSYLTLRLDDR